MASTGDYFRVHTGVAALAFTGVSAHVMGTKYCVHPDWRVNLGIAMVGLGLYVTSVALWREQRMRLATDITSIVNHAKTMAADADAHYVLWLALGGALAVMSWLVRRFVKDVRWHKLLLVTWTAGWVALAWGASTYGYGLDTVDAVRVWLILPGLLLWLGHTWLKETVPRPIPDWVHFGTQ